MANLTSEPIRDVRLSSSDRVLPAGRWQAVGLLGSSAKAKIGVGADGRLKDVPLQTLAPLEGYLIELRR